VRGYSVACQSKTDDTVPFKK